jgi:hypothetical protein
MDTRLRRVKLAPLAHFICWYLQNLRKFSLTTTNVFVYAPLYEQQKARRSLLAGNKYKSDVPRRMG